MTNQKEVVPKIPRINFPCALLFKIKECVFVESPREAKRAQRATAAAARAEAEERKRRDEELAAKAAALAAEAERERKAREPITESGTEIELEIVRIPPNPRLVIFAIGRLAENANVLCG